MVTSLRLCRGFADSQVTIFVDGAKHADDVPAVTAVQEYVQTLNLPNVSWSFREGNIGLRNSIYSGVSELVQERGRVIVLEDDLSLSPIALEYFNMALEYYSSESRVWSICGYIYDAPSLRDRRSAVILPFAHPWGWATWADRWEMFDLDNRPEREQLEASSFGRAFDLNGLYPFTQQLRNSIRRRISSWFIHWYYTVFQHGGVSIFPPRRVVENFGFTEGVHASTLNPYDRLVERPSLLDYVPEFSSADNVDFVALDGLRNCKEIRVQRLIAQAGSIKRALNTRGGV